MQSWAIALVAVLVIALVATIVYCIIAKPAWARSDYWQAHYLDSPWDVYARSSGGFDAAAELALHRATAAAQPTPAERMLAGTILMRNIVGQERRGTDPAETRQRIRRFNEARGHFAAAIGGLAEQKRPAADDAPIVGAALEFAFGGLAELLQNDRLIAELIQDDWGADAVQIPGFEDIVRMHGGVDRQMAAAAGDQHRRIVAERRAAAAAAPTRVAGADAYVAMATQNTSDSQNVHDSGVLGCLKAIVERLREDQAGAALPTPQAIAAQIRAEGAALTDGHPERVADIEAVIRRTAEGERVVALGATDQECLQRVWLRADDPRNAAARGVIREAVTAALWDCWEIGFGGRHIVCVNGRSSRILGALVLTDWDRRNWEVKRLEQFKNDIYALAAAIIRAEAAAAAGSGDPDTRQAGRAYLAQTADDAAAPEAALEMLAEKMRAAIGAMVDAQVAASGGAIPSYMAASIKEEAQAAA